MEVAEALNDPAKVRESKEEDRQRVWMQLDPTETRQSAHLVSLAAILHADNAKPVAGVTIRAREGPELA